MTIKKLIVTNSQCVNCALITIKASTSYDAINQKQTKTIQILLPTENHNNNGNAIKASTAVICKIYSNTKLKKSHLNKQATNTTLQMAKVKCCKESILILEPAMNRQHSIQF